MNQIWAIAESARVARCEVARGRARRITQYRRAGAPSTTTALDRGDAGVESAALRGLTPAPRGERTRARRGISRRVRQSTREVD